MRGLGWGRGRSNHAVIGVGSLKPVAVMYATQVGVEAVRAIVTAADRVGGVVALVLATHVPRCAIAAPILVAARTRSDRRKR